MNLTQAVELERYAVEVSAVPNADLFATVKMVTVPQMNKKHRDTKQPNPFTGRLLKHCEITGDVLIGPRMFADRVNSRRVKEGKAADFAVQKPSGRHHVEGTNAVTQADRDPAQFYFALYFVRSGKRPVRVKAWYELDGVPVRVTAESDFAAYLPPDFFLPKEEGKNQGLSEENRVITRTPKLESIVRVKCGRVSFDEEHRATDSPPDAVLSEATEYAAEPAAQPAPEATVRPAADAEQPAEQPANA